jgi:hypothetical protein
MFGSFIPKETAELIAQKLDRDGIGNRKLQFGSGRYELAVELGSCSKHKNDVPKCLTEDFKLMFLRCEVFDILRLLYLLSWFLYLSRFSVVPCRYGWGSRVSRGLVRLGTMPDE